MFHRVESRGGKETILLARDANFSFRESEMSSAIEFIFNSNDGSFHETRQDFWKRERRNFARHFYGQIDHK